MNHPHTITVDPSLEWYFKQLRLPAMFRSHQDLLERLQGEEKKRYQMWVEELILNEYEGRQIKGQVRRIRAAQFPVLKRFEEIDLQALPEAGRDVIDELKSLEFLKTNHNVLLIGSVGTGKTLMVTATGIQACEKGYHVWFRTAAGLINELKESKSKRQLLMHGRKIQKVDLLILDELGYISFDKEGAELLFEHLAMRYETKSTMVTSNLNFSEWNKIFQDPGLTVALLDRLTHNARIINMNGNSYRRRRG